MAETSLTDEKELLIKLRDGDENAFTQIYHRYKDKLIYHVLRMLKSEELAEELMQELFLKIWKNREHIDPEKSFRSYLYHIAGNMVYKQLYRASREREILDQVIYANSELYSHIEEGLFRKEQEAMLTEAMDLLPPKRCEVFKAVRIYGKSYKEVAAELGISVTTVNDHIQKATHFVKDYLQSKYGISFFLMAMLYFS